MDSRVEHNKRMQSAQSARYARALQLMRGFNEGRELAYKLS